MKLLVIEDDTDTIEVLRIFFAMSSLNVTLISAGEGGEGVALTEAESPEMVLLDLGLPDMHGFEVLSQIRTFTDVPVIILTVDNDEMCWVKGLELGADDYVVKPFRCAELLARIRAVLRRVRGEDAYPMPLEYGSVVIDDRSKEVRLDNKEISLTPTEYRLLCQLAGRRGQEVPVETLIEKVWGEGYLHCPDGLLKVHIHRLRRKLRETSADAHIVSGGPGRGYWLKVSKLPTVGPH